MGGSWIFLKFLKRIGAEWRDPGLAAEVLAS
jgi:hypothetical protein